MYLLLAKQTLINQVRIVCFIPPPPLLVSSFSVVADDVDLGLLLCHHVGMFKRCKSGLPEALICIEHRFDLLLSWSRSILGTCLCI